MDKVKITREQADAIDEMFRQGINNKYKIIELHVKEPNGWADHCIPLRNMSLDDLIRAVYIGYEVEETPEEKIMEYYKDQIKRAGSRDGTDHVSPAAIRHVLNLLNIKIEGVNA